MTKLVLNITIFFFLILALPNYLFASDGILYLSPESGIYAIGDTFEVRILLDSDEEPINAAEAELSFNSDEISVEGISTKDSIFDLWTITPSFSNETGVVEFAGGTRENFVGDNGLLVTITFKALRNIVSRANLTAGAILSADGRASNIITSMKSGVYTLEPQEIIAQAEYISLDDSPSAPILSSLTHPDEDVWYGEKTAEFTWEIPKDVMAVRLLVNDTQKSIPSILYEPPIDSKVVKDNNDGIWFFHIQMKNRFGWGNITHFRFQIDTEKPEFFEIVEQENENSTGSQVRFLFNASDKTSGIEKYEIQIDQGNPEIWRDDGSNIYSPPPLSSGKHTLLIKAVDKAGNYLLDSVSFTVESLGAPIFTKYPDVISTDDLIIIKGITLPNSELTVLLQKGNEPAKQNNIISDNGGNFTFIAGEKPEEGIYNLWIEVYGREGVKSAQSEKITFAVEPTDIIKFGSLAVQFLSIIIPLIALLMLLGLLAGYIWHRIDKTKNKLKISKRGEEND